jgi:polyphosphate kinase 2 (PPK2 family)
MKSRLEGLDLDKQIREKSDYREKLRALQLKLLHAQRLLQETPKNLVLVFEGPDAAGKGGVIKRMTERLDPRLVRVWSVVKPTEEEKKHHYLWRFWGKIPGAGETAIFDRSWYGRVLVERVEGFAKKEEWKRAYREINELERTLVDSGSIIMKFFLHITKSEQLRRFERRAADPYKHWKISEEDWRNRRKWNEHLEAAEEMFARTNSRTAPWNLIEGNYKWFARIKVMKLVVKRLEQEFGDL